MTSQVMTTDEIREQRKKPADPNTQVGLNTTGSFELTMRIANMLSQSTMVPEQFRAVAADKTANKVNGEYPLVANPNGLPNCVIAINMANRMGADPLMIMQNLYVVEGRPSWSSQFIVAAINSCGRYSPLRFDLEDKGEIEVTYQTKKWENGPNGSKGGYKHTDHKIKIKNLVCVAWAIEKDSGQRLESSPISMELAVKEGWYQKNGSKWQTMPEQMLRYRAASFFGRIYAPELLMGIRSADEVQDMIDVMPDPVPVAEPKTVDQAREMVAGQSEQADPDLLGKILDKIADAYDEPSLKSATRGYTTLPAEQKQQVEDAKANKLQVLAEYEGSPSFEQLKAAVENCNKASDLAPLSNFLADYPSRARVAELNGLVEKRRAELIALSAAARAQAEDDDLPL